MCGRYTLRQVAALQDRFQLEETIPDLAPRFNAAPTQAMPVIVQRADSNHLAMMRWGLVPAWAKDPHPSYATINARIEGIATKPAYRQPLRTQRCIVPCDGYYEWKQEGKRKQPYFVHRRDDHLFGLAGLYDIYRQPDGSELQSFTLITTAASALIAPLHSRMNVILRPENEAAWLDPTVHDPALVLPLLQTRADEMLEFYPVATTVNNVKNDRPDLIKRSDNFVHEATINTTQGDLFA